MTVRMIQDGALARLLIDRPDKRNAMSAAMYQAMPALIATAAASARLLLLTSATPGLFCAGADIAELAAMAGDRDWRAALQQAIDRAGQDLCAAAVPTVAFVDGDCIGGGCGLAMACDLRVATPRARFGITPARLGLVYPLHDTRRLIDLTGPAPARKLLFTGALIDADEALRIGLIDAIADTPDALIAAILATSSASHRATKAMIARILGGTRGADDGDASRAAFFDAFDGADFAEGVAAFTAKRPARFDG